MRTKEYEDRVLANVAVYVLSDQGEYIKGECVVIDGGLWLRGALLELPEATWEAMERARLG